MATKQLTATVRLNTKQAERSIDNLVKKINKINNTVNKIGNNNRVEQKLTRSQSKIQNIISKVNSWSKAHKSVEDGAKRINSQYKKSGSLLSTIGGKLRNLVDTYLGVMGMKAIIGTSDMITRAENKLNYVSAQQLGTAGYTTDASGNEVYSTATLNATQDAMDKMYASSQKVRMGYGDMMTNVSKSMALAGDAFNNNTDMAIRFQEIMAEAYAVGGASAQEMSSSMYQLIQALGSGVLAGDELRSVREGAPLAYKAIEEFAQKTLNTTKSLKDLGSQGLITAEMVTAAMLNAGDEMDKAFNQTEQTFTQTWEQIKNAAIYSFKPISETLRKELNKAIDNGLLQKVEALFTNIAKAVLIVFKVIKNVINWVADNWDWLKWVLIAGLLAVGAYFIWVGTQAVISAIQVILSMSATQWAILGVVTVVIALILVFLMWKTAAIDTCTAIVAALAVVGIAIFIIGILLANIPVIIIGCILLLLAVVFYFFEEVCYGAGWLAAWIVNIVKARVNFIIAIIQVLLAIISNAFKFIINLGIACGGALASVAKNIGIAFQNAWIWAKNTFWEFIADVLRGVSKLEPVINGIADLLGKNGVDFGGIISDVESKKSDYKDYVSVSDVWSNGLNTLEYQNLGDAWNKGLSTFEYVDPEQWGTTAGNWGAGVKDSINQWGAQFQNSGDGTSLLDMIGEKLGLDFSELGKFPDTALNLGDIGLGDALNGIGDDVSSIKDSMDLTEEDVEYLRKIAAMEWKKEYTIADISVDMSNYNTINGESDLDGIVTKLSEKLYEELNEVADGVYAY